MRFENLATVAPSRTLWSADQLSFTICAFMTCSFSSNLGNIWTFPIAPIATCGGKITGLAYVPPIEPIFDSYPCKMVRAKKTYFHRAVALGFQKGSPYLKLFNSRISYYRQNGLIANMAALKKDPKGSVKCTENHFDPLGYKTVFSAFAVLGIGLAFAIFYSTFEYFCKC